MWTVENLPIECYLRVSYYSNFIVIFNWMHALSTLPCSCHSVQIVEAASIATALPSCLCSCSFFFFLKYTWIIHYLFFIYLFIYFWLCWVFVSVWGLSLVAASGGHSSSRCTGLSLLRPLLLRSTGSRRAGSVIVAHRPSCGEQGLLFVVMHGLLIVVASLLWSTGSRHMDFSSCGTWAQ